MKKNQPYVAEQIENKVFRRFKRRQKLALCLFRPLFRVLKFDSTPGLKENTLAQIPISETQAGGREGLQKVTGQRNCFLNKCFLLPSCATAASVFRKGFISFLGECGFRSRRPEEMKLVEISVTSPTSHPLKNQ